MSRKKPTSTAPLPYLSTFVTSQNFNNTRFGHLGLVTSRTLAPNRFILRGSLLSLCVIAFLMSDVRSTYASCGDYVLKNETLKSSHTSGSDQLGYSAPIQMTHIPVPSKQRSPVRPCSGPHCDQREKSPLVPHRVVEISFPMDVILSAFDLQHGNHHRASAPLVFQLEISDGPIDSIFKPPRG